MELCEQDKINLITLITTGDISGIVAYMEKFNKLNLPSNNIKNAD